MSLYSVGTYQVVLLEGLDPPGAPPETIVQTAMPVQRPGVDGTGFIQLGKKAAAPFRMRSLVDLTTRPLAQALIDAYRGLVNTGLLKLTHASRDYSTAPTHTQYWVLDVQANWRRVSCAAGGLNAGNYVVSAIWTFVPVYVPPPPPEED